ncbi:hypothetical protein GCM10027596_35790 [Nocardioides korecus]
MAAYAVVQGTQVHLDGKTYDGGATLPTLGANTAAQWLNAGWIEPVTTKPARKG